MATIILRTNTIVNALGLFCLVLLVHKSAAYEFVVGGQKGWSVPSDPNFNPYNQWAEKGRFQIGDSLVFNYPSGQDSVIQVNREDYDSCNTGAHSEKFSDGHTVFKLNKSGTHFFISGNKDNCLKNEKLVVIVLADRSNTNQTSTASPSSSPSPSPSSSAGSSVPSPSPSRESSTPLPSQSTKSSAPSPSKSTVSSAPSPAPAQQEASSPPEGTVETNPTPAPVSDSEPPPPPPPPPNAASSVLVSFAGSVGAFTASVLVFSL